MKSRYTRSTFYGGAPLVGYASWGDRRDEQEEKIRGFFGLSAVSVASKELILGRLFEDYLLFADREGHRHVKITWFERRTRIRSCRHVWGSGCRITSGFGDFSRHFLCAKDDVLPLARHALRIWHPSHGWGPFPKEKKRFRCSS